MADGKSSAQRLANELNQLAGYNRFYADFAKLSSGKGVNQWAIYDRKTGKNYAIGSFVGDFGITQLRNELKKQNSSKAKGTIKSTKLSLRHEDTEFNEAENPNDVKHYGVIGMKWGVRKDPQRAHTRASQKLDKLDKKATKAASKISQKEAKSVAKQRKADSAVLFKKSKARAADKAIGKTEKARNKYFERVEKAKNWYSKMENAFRDVKINQVNQHYVDLGKKYANTNLESLLSDAQINLANKELRKYYRDMGR